MHWNSPRHTVHAEPSYWPVNLTVNNQRHPLIGGTQNITHTIQPSTNSIGSDITLQIHIFRQI